MYLCNDIIQLIYYKYYKHIVLQELKKRTNKILHVMNTYKNTEVKQIICFEKIIKEGNERKYIIYDSCLKKCYSVQINPLWGGLEQAPTKSLKDVIFA